MSSKVTKQRQSEMSSSDKKSNKPVQQQKQQQSEKSGSNSDSSETVKIHEKKFHDVFINIKIIMIVLLCFT